MFKFNFSNPGENADAQCQSSVLNQHSKDTDSSTAWFPAREITATVSPIIVHKASVFVCGKYKLQHIPAKKVLKELANSQNDEGVIEAETEHSDLIPAKYEGGLKVWECTSDLASFLVDQNVDFSGKRVLDLGCGTGLLGILAIYLKATSVDFQDYNASVIDSTTIPNVSINMAKLEQERIAPCTRYFAGDWQSFAELFNKESIKKYDFILTCETIYNPDNYRKLLHVFKTCLLPDGVIYLAAKVYYFGVGGGIRQFENMLTEDATFHGEVCWKCCEGVQREILRITFDKSQKTDM